MLTTSDQYTIHFCQSVCCKECSQTVEVLQNGLPWQQLMLIQAQNPPHLPTPLTFQPGIETIKIPNTWSWISLVIVSVATKRVFRGLWTNHPLKKTFSFVLFYQLAGLIIISPTVILDCLHQTSRKS